MPRILAILAILALSGCSSPPGPSQTTVVLDGEGQATIYTIGHPVVKRTFSPNGRDDEGHVVTP